MHVMWPDGFESIAIESAWGPIMATQRWTSFLASMATHEFWRCIGYELWNAVNGVKIDENLVAFHVHFIFINAIKHWWILVAPGF